MDGSGHASKNLIAGILTNIILTVYTEGVKIKKNIFLTNYTDK